MKNPNQSVSQNLTQKIKAALHVYAKSLTSIKYYKDLIKTDLKFSLKYYVVLAVLFTMVNSLFSTIQILPKLKKGINDALDYALNMYEDDLVITIEKGVLSVNKDEPYIIPLSTTEETSSVAKNLIVFDSDAGLDDLEETYDTLILVNGTNILAKSSSDISVMPIKDIPDTTITKENLVSVVTRIRFLTKFAPYIVGILFILATFSYYLGYRLIYLFLVGAFLWVIGTVRKLKFSYSKYYKIALHTMSLPLTVGLVNSITAANIYFPSWFFLLNLIFGVLVVLSLEENGKDQTASNSEDKENKPDSELKEASDGEIIN